MASIPTKRTQVSSGTSFEEQAIYYYIKQLFQDTVNRGKYSFNENESIELDIYIPCLHFAIEYDGAYWHKDKTDIDNHKNDILSDAGVHLVRVRECGLADLDHKYGDIIYRKTSSKDNGLHLQEVINEIVKIIYNYVNANDLPITKEIKDSLVSFNLSKEELIDKRPNIYAQYHTVFKDDNITTTCLINHWDYQKNGNLLPQNVSIKSGIFVVLTCPKGHSFHVQPSRYKIKPTLKKENCSRCMLNFCPALLDRTICPSISCDIYENAHSNAIFVPSWEGNNHKFFAQTFKIDIETSNCTNLLIKNMQPLYDQMWFEIKEKISKFTNSITTEDMLMWLTSIDWSEQFRFVQMIEESNNQNFISKLKAVLSDQKNFAISIKIDEKIDPLYAIKILKTFGSKRFNYPSLQYFDNPSIIQEFCDLLLSECRCCNSVQINDVALTMGIQKEYQLLSPLFSAHLYKLLLQLEQINTFPRSEECKQLLYPKAETQLSILEDNIAKSIISKIRNCSSITKEQIRSWIDATLSPQREQIIHLLYQKGFLKLIGNEAYDSTGCKFLSKELNIDLISDIDTQLNIMSILGIHRFKYSLKSFDSPKFSNRFINLIKKSADTSDEFLISGYDSDQLKVEILANIDTLSYEFAKQLYIMLMYLSTTVDRPYPCWYDDDPEEVMSALKRKLTGKEQHLITKREVPSSPLPLGITITFPDDVRAKHEAEIRELEEFEKQYKLHNHKIDEEDAEEKFRRRSKGLCEHCGGIFKKKFLLFGRRICTKCGRKKDY